MSKQSSRVQLIQQLSADERLWQPDPMDWLKEQDTMVDDKTRPSAQDRRRINLTGKDEVSNWTEILGTTEEELRKAVAAVGNQAGVVREHLRKK
jgi:hypothetical protein